MTLLEQFFFANINFIISVFAVFVFFTTGWLFMDSWKIEKNKKTTLIRSLGFFILTIAALLNASALNSNLVFLIIQVSKVSGLFLIWVSLLKEPILHPPKKEKFALLLPFSLPALSFGLSPLTAVLMLIIAATYFRKATEGLDKQTKPAAIAFFLLAISEFISISFYAQNTTNVFYSQLLTTYGPVWILAHIFEFLGLIILFKWVWGYIRFRLQSQLFILTVTGSLIIFLITTVMFTYLLFKNIETDTLSHLNTDVRVLQFSLEKLQDTALTNAQAMSQDLNLKTALISRDKNSLYDNLITYLSSQKSDFIIATDQTGEVLMRTQDRDKTGDTLGSDPIVKSALEGKPLSTISKEFGILAPVVSIKAAAPIKQASDSATIDGSIVTGFLIDNAFVDAVRKITGLEVTIFVGDKRAATTFVGPDGKSRLIGSKETNQQVTQKVLKQGQTYSGSSQIFNQPYYTIYSPLKTYGGATIGILFVGRLENELFDTAQRSLNLTFLGSIILIVFSLGPAYLFSKFLTEHLEA